MAADKETDERDNHQIITDELQRYGGPQKSTATSRFICCPLPEHGNDKTPSCGIFMQIDAGIPLGFYHCFGCGGKGPWNALAEKVNWTKIKEWRKSADIAQDLITPAVEDSLLGDSGLTFNAVLKRMQCQEAQRWPITMNWRGFSGQLIHDVGGHIVNDQRKESIGVLFPVKINGKVRGGLKAVFEREGKELAYTNMAGTWTRDYGLFPYMYTMKMIRKRRLRFVFLVEGPRDALRLVSLGLPALAILGATSMSDIKTLLVANLDVTHVYVISDNDAGGDVMWKSVKKFMKKAEMFKVSRMQLPKKKDEDGKLIKMDPGNAPKKIIRRIKTFLKEAHGYDDA